MKERSANANHIFKKDSAGELTGAYKKLVVNPGVYRGARPDPLVAAEPAPVPAPKVEVAPAVERVPKQKVEWKGQKRPYEEIRKTWSDKNAYHRETDALATFVAEGGQELVAIYGPEKVADALEAYMKMPADVTSESRIGLYMLIRALEPKVRGREELYLKMEKAVDDAVKRYEDAYDALKTKEARANFQIEEGGNYAPTEGSGKLRREHINDYRTFDRRAFSPLAGAMEVVRPTSTRTKYAVEDLRGAFDGEEFVRAVKIYGSIEKYIVERVFAEEAMEQHLETLKAERLAELDKEFRRRHREISAAEKVKLDAIVAREKALLGEQPFLASDAEDIVEWRQDALRVLFDRREDIKAQLLTATDAGEKKKLEDRIATIDSYGNALVKKRHLPDSPAVRAAHEAFRKEREELAIEIETRAGELAGKVLGEIKNLKALNVKEDK